MPSAQLLDRHPAPNGAHRPGGGGVIAASDQFDASGGAPATRAFGSWVVVSKNRSRSGSISGSRSAAPRRSRSSSRFRPTSLPASRCPRDRCVRAPVKIRPPKPITVRRHPRAQDAVAPRNDRQHQRELGRQAKADIALAMTRRHGPKRMQKSGWWRCRQVSRERSAPDRLIRTRPKRGSAPRPVAPPCGTVRHASVGDRSTPAGRGRVARRAEGAGDRGHGAGPFGGEISTSSRQPTFSVARGGLSPATRHAPGFPGLGLAARPRRYGRG